MKLHWQLVLLMLGDGVILLVGDETTVTKAGHKTHGLGRYFCSIYNQAVPGLSFLSLVLVEVSSGKDYPVLMEQVNAQAKSVKKPKLPKKPGPGRPKGSCNANRREPELSPWLSWLQGLLLALMGQSHRPAYFVYDNALANNAAVAMLRPFELPLISKLKRNAALWIPWRGVYSGRGAPRKYGDKVNTGALIPPLLSPRVCPKTINL